MNKEEIGQLQSKFSDEKSVPLEKKEQHSFYGTLIGKIKDVAQLAKYDIDDPNSEILLQKSQFYLQKASACFQQKALQLFFPKDYTPAELHLAIKYYTEEEEFMEEYISRAKSNSADFRKKYSVSSDFAFGCCLALSYYTGTSSQRISRTSNIIIKLFIGDKASSIKESQQYDVTRCIGQWLFRALNCIQLYWGKVTRCVDISANQRTLYQPGNVVTWLQFSSSSYGSISAYFGKRNTRFVIYCLSGRCIEDYSNYKDAESEVLFKPFSHFIVFKRQKHDTVQYVYMRELFIGQSKKNILWVDDNIFNGDWENKKMMEMAIRKDPLINIIPKISTECALAFLRSEIGVNRNINEFRIITDMNRLNQKLSHNAGARLIYSCKKMYLQYAMMIFTSSEKKAEQMLEEMKVDLNKIQITVVTNKALNFLQFE